MNKVLSRGIEPIPVERSSQMDKLEATLLSMTPPVQHVSAMWHISDQLHTIHNSELQLLFRKSVLYMLHDHVIAHFRRAGKSEHETSLWTIEDASTHHKPFFCTEYCGIDHHSTNDSFCMHNLQV